MESLRSNDIVIFTNFVEFSLFKKKFITNLITDIAIKPKRSEALDIIFYEFALFTCCECKCIDAVSFGGVVLLLHTIVLEQNNELNH